MAKKEITQAYVLEYKRVSRQLWHDQAWHDFMTTGKADAVGFALNELPQGDTIKDIVLAAQDYYDTVEEGSL